MATTERIKFRLLHMPCCGTLLCWVNPRLPSFCPECSKVVYMQLKTGEHTRISSPATLIIEEDFVL